MHVAVLLPGSMMTGMYGHVAACPPKIYGYKFQFISTSETATCAPPSLQRLQDMNMPLGISGLKLCLGCGPELQVDST